MNNKEFPQLIRIDTIDRQQVIINNNVVQMKETILKCPVCGGILYSFGKEVELLSAKLYVSKDESFKEIKYCHYCGQKLNFDFSLVGVQDAEVVKEYNDESVCN